MMLIHLLRPKSNFLNKKKLLRLHSGVHIVFSNNYFSVRTEMSRQQWRGKMCSTEKWIETVRGPAKARSELQACKRKIFYYEQQIKESNIRKNAY